MEPRPMIDPLKDAKKIAVGEINAVAKDKLGAVLGPVLGDDLVDLLGLGSHTPDYTAYFEQIEQGIDELKSQLQALQQAVAQIQQKLGEALEDIRQLQEEVIESEMQAALRSFVDRSAIIRQSFESFVNAVAALSSADPDDRRQAASDLFELLDLLNLQQVAIALADLRSLVNPTLSGSSGLPDLHLKKLGAALAAAVPDDGHYVASGPFGDIAWGADLSARIEAPIQAELGHAGATFRAFAHAELQGLILLTVGWGNTIQSPQLLDHVQSLDDALARLGRFEAEVLEGTASFPGIEPLYRQKLTALTSGGGRFAGAHCWSSSLPRLDGSEWRTPFPSAWLAWSLVDPQTASIALPGWIAFQPGEEEDLQGCRLIWARPSADQVEAMDSSQLPPFVLTGAYPLPESLAFIRNLAAPPAG